MRGLATGKGDILDRVGGAVAAFAGVSIEDIPDGLRDEAAALFEKIKRYGIEEAEGVDPTVLAGEMWDFAIELGALPLPDYAAARRALK
jgi:hypothetical protein